MYPGWQALNGAAKWHKGRAGGGGGGSRWDEVFWTTNHMRLRVRAILIQCASKQLKKPNFTSGCFCEFVTPWPICSSQPHWQERAWELLALINTEHAASTVHVSMHQGRGVWGEQAVKRSPARKKKKKARWVPIGWETGWMTIDWPSTLIYIHTSFWPNTFSWQAATALTYEDVVCRCCSELGSFTLESSALMQHLLASPTNWLALSRIVILYAEWSQKTL